MPTRTRLRVIYVDDRVEDIVDTADKVTTTLTTSLDRCVLYCVPDLDEFALKEMPTLADQLRRRFPDAALELKMGAVVGTEGDGSERFESYALHPDRLIRDILADVAASTWPVVVLVDVRLTGFSAAALERASVPRQTNIGFWVAEQIAHAPSGSKRVCVYTRTPAMDAVDYVSPRIVLISKEDPLGLSTVLTETVRDYGPQRVPAEQPQAVVGQARDEQSRLPAWLLFLTDLGKMIVRVVFRS